MYKMAVKKWEKPKTESVRKIRRFAQLVEKALCKYAKTKKMQNGFLALYDIKYLKNILKMV